MRYIDCVYYCAGEVSQSYGYGASGQSSTAGMFNSYGESFGPGDVIGCFVVSRRDLVIKNFCTQLSTSYIYSPQVFGMC